jgi:hypothetical protein
MAAAAARAWYLALMVMRSKNAKYNCDGEEKEKVMTKSIIMNQLEILEKARGLFQTSNPHVRQPMLQY